MGGTPKALGPRQNARNSSLIKRRMNSRPLQETTHKGLAKKDLFDAFIFFIRGTIHVLSFSSENRRELTQKGMHFFAIQKCTSTSFLYHRRQFPPICGVVD